MKNLALGSSLLFGLGFWTVGCGDSESNPCPTGQVECDGVCIDEVEPTLTSIQSGVFEISCTASSCHDANFPAEMLDLSSLSASEANLINVEAQEVDFNRVTPGDIGASYLMNKLLGVDMAPDTDRMPQLDPDGLCDAKLQAVEQWIEAGAPID